MDLQGHSFILVILFRPSKKLACVKLRGLAIAALEENFLQVPRKWRKSENGPIRVSKMENSTLWQLLLIPGNRSLAVMDHVTSPTLDSECLDFFKFLSSASEDQDYDGNFL